MTSRDKSMTIGNRMTKSMALGSISMAFASAFVDFSVLLGADRDAMLAQCGLTAMKMEVEGDRLSIEVFHKLAQTGKAMTNEPGLVPKFASHADFSEVSIAGLIANASPTMLDALLQLNRYGRLAIDVPYHGESSLMFEFGDVDDFILDQRIPNAVHADILEISFTYLITGPRAFLPREHVVSVELMGARPKHVDVLEQIWQCPIQFNAPRNAIRIPKWVAGHPVRLQPDYVFDILSRHAEGLLKSAPMQSEFSAKLERLIMAELHTGEVTIEWVSQRLNLSRQSIYRRLKAENTTFEELFDNLRHRMALVYLLERKSTVSETAFLLGFSDPSPFSRAFKRWTGKTPAAYAKGN
jgi:AraC-like DNA-binding protein